MVIAPVSYPGGAGFVGSANTAPVTMPETMPNTNGAPSLDDAQRVGRAGASESATAPGPGPGEVERATQAAETVNGLTDQELALVRRLAARDREVRAHEQAHAAVGGPYAGSPSYSYQRGPDGRRYAVGGEVPIDVSPIPGDPQATIQKARIVRRAALAPAQPSSQDRAVAARASALEREARAQLLTQESATRGAGAPPDKTPDSTYRPIDLRA